MIKVVGVKFKRAGKVYYFDPKDLKMERDMGVIVETANGIEYGTVVLPELMVKEEDVVSPLKEIVRIATEEDERKVRENREKEADAMRICQEKINKHNPEMKLVSAEYAFDGSKVLFNFTADGRVDFRELVKDLASVFKTRIELRQIGVRDETKICGGMGICGRELCCSSYLSDFASVSIKMAKEQGLSLNPTKISGLCGRLMCCLKNEQETYEELNSRLPLVGTTVKTPEGLSGQVQAVNVLRQRVKVVVDVDDEKELREYAAAELKFSPHKKKSRDRAAEQENPEEAELQEDL